MDEASEPRQKKEYLNADYADYADFKKRRNGGVMTPPYKEARWMEKKTVAIFGTSKVGEGESIFEAAYSLGAELAASGFAIVNGGYGGTMLAAAKWASEKNGVITGVTCSAFKRSGANQYITKEILTATLQERLNTLIELGDAYIVLAGGTGTLLELAEVWELKNKHFLPGDKPIIILGKFWKPVVELIKTQDCDSVGCLCFAETPKEAVEILKQKLK